VDVAALARRSSYSVSWWRAADAELEQQGFGEEDRKAVLTAAAKNRRNPRIFAKAAIRLRRHVEAGMPLS